MGEEEKQENGDVEEKDEALDAAEETGAEVLELTPEEKDISRCVKKSILRTIKVMCKMKLAQDPAVEKKKIIQWRGKYNILRPHEYMFTSVIKFCHGKQDSSHKMDGVIVLFYPEMVVDTLLKGLQVKLKDDFDVMDGCGEFCNVVAGNFKMELVKLGYDELEISLPVSFVGEIDELFEYKGEAQLEFTYVHGDDEDPFLKIFIALKPSILKNKKKKGDAK